MNIVILDSPTVGHDVELVERISRFGDVVTYDITKPEQTAERIKDADIVLTNKVVIGKKELDTAKNLKLICVMATGYNNIDVAEARKYNVVVANVKGYSTESVAQLVMTYMLVLQTSIMDYVKATRNGKWHESEIFTMLNYPVIELAGKKLGIIGYGAIGRRVGALAKAFGMQLLIAARDGVEYDDDTERKNIDYVIENADIITIHTPLTPETQNMINADVLNRMKKEAILINTARGQIVNLDDLYTALKNNVIRAAALDVMPVEPPADRHPIFDLENVLITPHIAWTSVEARRRLVDGICDNITKFLNGQAELIRL